jgi:hypothetical protein
MQTGLTFGDILQQNKAPRYVSAPLGLALDIMFDPVNWLTMGTGALIPRMGAGLIKGGIKDVAKEGAIKAGAKTLAIGATSNLAKKAFNVGRFTGLNKVFTGTAEGLATHAVEGARRFDTAIGSTVEDRIGKGILTGLAEEIPGLRNIAPKAGQTFAAIEKFATKTPAGKKIWEGLKYSPAETARVVNEGDMANGILAEKGLRGVLGSVVPDFKTLEDLMASDASVQAFKDGKGLVNAAGEKIMTPVWKTIQGADRVIDTETIGRLVTIPAGYDNSRRILGGLIDAAGTEKTIFNAERLKKFYETIKPGRTGVSWYDRVLDRLETTTVRDMWHFRLGTGDVEGLAKSRDAQKLAKINAAGPEMLAKNDAKTMELLKQKSEEVVTTWNNVQTSMKNFNDWHILEGLLKGERATTALFKLFKVPLNLSSHVVAILGNLVMGKMGGLPVESVAFQASLKKSLGIMTGTGGADALNSVFLNDVNSFITMMEKNPQRFRNTFGQTAGEIQYQINQIKKKFPEAKVPTLAEMAAIQNELQSAVKRGSADLIAAKIRLGETSEPFVPGAIPQGAERREALQMKTGVESVSKGVAEGEDVSKVGPGSWSANETLNVHGNFVENLGKFATKRSKENPNNIGYMIMDKVVNGMPKSYEHIDQGFKLATVDFLTHHGLTESELTVVTRFMDDFDYNRDIVKLTTAEEAIQVERRGLQAEKLYLLTPLKASEVAMETFMNYSAMPDFVRVMRALPFVGSPFYSFPYAMGAKLGKTLIHNPAVFNKIGFAMNDFSGLRTPDEKKALTEKYNVYLNSPTVVRIGGMWNTDIKNWVPYYTMNMLSPSERQYDESWQGKMLQMSDKFPILQHPAGQVIKDYYIQPWLLAGTKNVPQGQFGQPILPYYDPVTGRRKEPSTGLKSGLAARTLAESYIVPGTASLFGPALSGLSRDTLEALPIGYGARSTAYAAQGKTSLGVMSKENVMQKTIRSLASKAGLPLYTLDTTKTNLTK